MQLRCKMVKEDEIKILDILRKDGRRKLTDISRETNMPVATVYEKLKKIDQYIIKNTTLLNFSRMNYPLSIIYMIRTDMKRSDIIRFITNCPNINNAYRSSDGFNYLVEAIFKNMREANEFRENLIIFGTKSIIEHPVLETLKKEDMLLAKT